MSNYNKSKGSQWSRWDLHIHTKGTNKKDDFTSATFDEFCITLFKEALAKDIVAIGITDYFSIDNYRKVIHFVSQIDTLNAQGGNAIFSDEDKSKIKSILIIPNVELRMMPSTDSGRLINIHCLFNPVFVDSIENDFFGSIEYSAGPGNRHKMNKQGMIDLGKSLDRTLNDDEANKKGLATFVVSHGDLQVLLDTKTNFRENVIVVVSNSNNDGASGLQKHYDLFESETVSQLDAVRKSIYCLSHAIFSSNPEDRKYFLGEKVDSKEVVSAKCGSLKPCIHGSDAHIETKLFNPDNNAYCWIKAEPTFEGLKQILWEPGDRVKIQERNPSDTKSSRIIIDNVTYKNPDGNKVLVSFSKDLNSIIGTRGSGKSTLLKNIAIKVDPQQFSEKDNPDRLYPLQDFKVMWGDGQNDHGSDDSPKSVFYIPQNYLSSLAYDEGEKSKERDQFLTRLLKKHNRFSNAIQTYEEFVANNKVRVEGLVQELLKANTDITETSILLKKQGSKIEIDKETVAKNEEIKKYKGTGADAITEDELNKFSTASRTITGNKKIIQSLNQDSQILSALKQNGANILVANQEFGRLSIKRQELLRSELIKQGNASLLSLVNKELTSISKEIKILEKEVETQTKILEPLEKKIKANKALEGLTKELSELQQILIKINELTLKLDQAKLLKNKSIESLVSAYNDFDAQQQSIFGTVQFDDIFSFLKIETVTYYNTQDLKLFIERNVNTRDSNARLKQDTDILPLLGDSPVKPNANAIRKVITGLIDKTIVIKVEANNDIGQVLSQLLNNRFEIDYLNSVKTKDDNTHFKDMTGGQKAIALLELVFRFDDEKYPILIDQPEDDLDVVGVATDLVNFIKSEKAERQIIIVSHNASLVVCADSEEVVLSSSVKHSHKKYNFSYLTGAIENLAIRTEIIKVLEGGKDALRQRARKLNFKGEI